MKRFLFSIVLLPLLAALTPGCAPEPEIVEKQEEPVPAGRSFLCSSQSAAFSYGDGISVFSDKYNLKYVCDSAGAVSGFSGKYFEGVPKIAAYPYSISYTRTDSGFECRIPSRTGLLPGERPDSIFVARGDADNLVFIPASSMVSFSLASTSVSEVRFSGHCGEFVSGKAAYSFGSDGKLTVSADSTSVSVVPSSGGVFSPGTYFFAVAPGVLREGYDLEVIGASSTLDAGCRDNVILGAGEVLPLGEIDTEFVPVPGLLSVPFYFKLPDKLLDVSAETGSGGDWPFSEPKGSSSVHGSGRTIFHTKTEGYPLVANIREYYVNSKGGWQVYTDNVFDFVEFPTFESGKIISVTLASGTSVFNPYFTDSGGNILKGGESAGETKAATLYRWDFSDTRIGEPCRMFFGKAGTIQILQMTATYEMSVVPEPRRISSVTVSDPTNSAFVNPSVEVSVEPAAIAGASLQDVQCGVEMWNGMGDHVLSKDLPGPDWKGVVDIPEDGVFTMRGWACSPGGCREYSEPIRTGAGQLKISFWRNSAGYSPVTSSTAFKSGSGPASEDNGSEHARRLKNTDVDFWTFVPSAASCYMDTNTKAGLRVASSGESCSPVTYIKFPALKDKALSEVSITTHSTCEGRNCFLCLDPSSPSAAQSSSVSVVTTLAEGASAIISCSMVPSDTPCYLVFPDKELYQIHEIGLKYEKSSIAPLPGGFVEEPDDPSADPSGSFDYSVLNTMGHPRLLIDKAGFEDIRTKITSGRSSNVFLTDVSMLIVSVADKFVSGPVKVTYTLDASDKRLLTMSRNAFKQLAVLSYAYRITGKPKYLDAARIVLRDVCAFDDWHTSHYLDTAEMCFGVALAYDWLYESLSLEERRLIHEKIREYALKTSLNAGFHGVDNNWNQVCNAGIVAGALAVYEKDKAISVQTIEKALVSNRRAMNVIYSPDGNYCEGYGYWNYGTGFQAMLMKMFETAFGTTLDLAETPGFLKTAGYMLFMSGPCGQFSYADGGGDSEGATTGIWWFARHLDDKSLLFNEMRVYKSGLYNSKGDTGRLLPLIPAIVRDFNVDDFSSVSPSKDIWHGDGLAPVVMVHKGWNYDAGDCYLGIKGGSASTNHAHMDAGSFVFDALGCRWSGDVTHAGYSTMENALKPVGGVYSNMSQESYRWDIVGLNNLQHSTISIAASDGTVSRRYPTDHYAKGMATVIRTIETSSEMGAVLDMGAPLKGQVSKATRTVKVVGTDKLVVIDEITALSGLDAPVIWNLVTPASVSASSSGVVLTSSGKKMYLKASASDASIVPKYYGGLMKRPDSWTPRTWDPSYNAYNTGFELTVPAGKTITITTTLSKDQ